MHTKHTMTDTYKQKRLKEIDWKELYRLASLVGTDAKNPKENLKKFISQIIDQVREQERERLEKRIEQARKEKPFRHRLLKQTTSEARERHSGFISGLLVAKELLSKPNTP